MYTTLIQDAKMEILAEIHSCFAAGRRNSMPVLKPRTRLLSVRLSEEEYQDLTSICIAEGARSMSDVARAAICDFIGKGTIADGLLQLSVRHLQERIEELENEVRRLNRVVGANALAMTQRE